MANITNEFRIEVIEALKKQREIFSGTEKRFASTYGINPAVWSELKKGEYIGKLKDAKWIALGRALNVLTKRKPWKAVKTDVFLTIEQDVLFCKEHSKGRIFVDDCAIGKSFTAKYLNKSLPNCFYVDCSQAKTRTDFIRAVAFAVGVDPKQRLTDALAETIYYLNSLEEPVVIIDEAGDLNQAAFLELKALWNATEGACGWYMMGADGLRDKIDRGYRNKRLGFAEIFSRFSDRYTRVTPLGKEERMRFYHRLVQQVLTANIKPEHEDEMPQILKKCLVNDNLQRIGGLRRAESILILHEKANAKHIKING